MVADGNSRVDEELPETDVGLVNCLGTAFTVMDCGVSQLGKETPPLLQVQVGVQRQP